MLTPVTRCPADVLASADDSTEAPTAAPQERTPSRSPPASSTTPPPWWPPGSTKPSGETPHQRPWVALVDGNSHQIDRIRPKRTAGTSKVTTIIELIHVIEYLWRSARSFYAEDDPR